MEESFPGRDLETLLHLVGVFARDDAVEDLDVGQRHEHQVEGVVDGDEGEEELDDVDEDVQSRVESFAPEEQQERDEGHHEYGQEHRVVVHGRVVVVRDVLVVVRVEQLGELSFRRVHHFLVHIRQQGDQHVQHNHQQ